MSALSNNSASCTFHGIGVSSGIIIAKSCSREFSAPAIPLRQITKAEIPGEKSKLSNAVDSTIAKLIALRDELKNSLSEEHSRIIDFHIDLLQDNELCDNISQIIEEKLCGVEQAIQAAVDDACHPLLSSGKPFFMERAADIQDVGRRLLLSISSPDSAVKPIFPSDGQPVVLLCGELPPTVAAKLSHDKVAAIVSSSGSRTSHSAILAQSMGIPAIVAVKEDLSKIPDGTTIVLDVAQGIAIVNPDEGTISKFREKKEKLSRLMRELSDLADTEPETLDGYQVRLVANVSLLSEAQFVKEHCCTGIGLFRTEFLLLDRGKFLTEEEQFEIYSKTVRTIYPYSVIFRTLDIGGDKVFPLLTAHHQETNPFMGMRAIRYSLQHRDFFKSQLRALLRSTTEGKMRVMFPMISTIEELKSSLAILDEVKADLLRENIPFSDDFDIGCMIEVPSAVQIADQLIKYVDFFSIGTNDLTQYTLAVDRGNADVAYLYQPANPAVLRQIKRLADIACQNGKWISICGEMAGNPLYTPLILGMGIHELSMTPGALPAVKNILRSIRLYESEELLDSALECHDAEQVRTLCREFIAKSCPNMSIQEQL